MRQRFLCQLGLTRRGALAALSQRHRHLQALLLNQRRVADKKAVEEAGLLSEFLWFAAPHVLPRAHHISPYHIET